MKKTSIIVGVIVLILILVFVGWQFLNKKSAEGGTCKSVNNCEAGLKCISNTCSSGKAGSVCISKTDCLTLFCVERKCTEGKKDDSCIAKTDCSTNYCVNGKCTEGKKDEACSTYKDCQKGLFCKTGVCSEPPSYSQYFTKIVISKMKIGLPPGPDNIPIATTEFKTTDAIEVDLTGVKSTTRGEFYYEAVDTVTGEVVFTSSGYPQKIEGRDIGTGSDMPRVIGKGEFDLNIYYNNEMVYTTVIKVTE